MGGRWRRSSEAGCVTTIKTTPCGGVHETRCLYNRGPGAVARRLWPVLGRQSAGSFPGVTIDAKLIGGQEYEPLYARIPEWEKLTGAKVNILAKKNGFDIDK